MEAMSNLWLPLGSLLVAQSVVSAEEIEQALAEQRRSGGRLGEILIARGYTSRAAIIDALAQQAELLFELDAETSIAADQALHRDLAAVLLVHAKDATAPLEDTRDTAEALATDFAAAINLARHHLAARRAELRAKKD
jgi:hypothetical protein